LARSGLVTSLGGRRERTSTIRFYECATYSRLASAFVYPTSFLSVLCAYVLYDVDLALVLVDAIIILDCGFVELLVCVLLVACTAWGLVFDYRVCGYGWDVR